MVSTLLKNINQLGNLPQIGVKTKNKMFETATQTPIRDKEAESNTSDFDVLDALKIPAVELPDHSAVWKNKIEGISSC